MNNLKKLELEYEGIRNTILNYKSDANILNFLNGLKQNMHSNDIESITYYIKEICKWYTDNINEIHCNEFVTDYTSHDRNKKLLAAIYQELKQQKEYERYKRKNEKNMYSKIFLSHNSSDKKYGNALRDLLMDLHITKERLIYTSHPLHKIPTNDNIFEYLKKNINRDIFVIFLWSNEYLKSAACLNEMGAAWISECGYINIFTPDFDFENPQFNNCAVDTRKMGIVLKNDEQCKTRIIELKDELAQDFKLNIDEQEWILNLDKFMKSIS